MAQEHECKYETIVRETHKMVKDMHKAIYVGNGKESLVVQMDRLNGFKKFSIWFFSAVTIAGIGIIARLITIKLTT